MTVNQISIFLENKTGQLASITRLLADNDIDLRALSIAETEDYGILRILVNKPSMAIGLLKENGYIASTTPVVAVGVDDQPGGLCRVLELIARKAVGIDYMYSLFCEAVDHAVMVFQTKNPEELSSIFEEEGMIVLSGKQIGINEEN